VGYLAIVSALFAIEFQNSILAVLAFALGFLALVRECFK
jgi:hypothetical protein